MELEDMREVEPQTYGERLALVLLRAGLLAVVGVLVRELVYLIEPGRHHVLTPYDD